MEVPARQHHRRLLLAQLAGGASVAGSQPVSSTMRWASSSCTCGGAAATHRVAAIMARVYPLLRFIAQANIHVAQALRFAFAQTSILSSTSELDVPIASNIWYMIAWDALDELDSALDTALCSAASRRVSIPAFAAARAKLWQVEKSIVWHAGI